MDDDLRQKMSNQMKFPYLASDTCATSNTISTRSTAICFSGGAVGLRRYRAEVVLGALCCRRAISIRCSSCECWWVARP
jgi:hypothetical protein